MKFNQLEGVNHPLFVCNLIAKSEANLLPIPLGIGIIILYIIIYILYIIYIKCFNITERGEVLTCFMICAIISLCINV